MLMLAGSSSDTGAGVVVASVLLLASARPSAYLFAGVGPYPLAFTLALACSVSNSVWVLALVL